MATLWSPNPKNGNGSSGETAKSLKASVWWRLLSRETTHPTGELEEGVCQCRQIPPKSGALNPLRTVFRRNTTTLVAFHRRF